MKNQEKVNSLKLGFQVMQGKPEGEYIVIDSNEKQLNDNCLGYQMDILKKIKEQLAKDIEESPNLVNDEIQYKIMLFISNSSVILHAPLAVLKSGLKSYFYSVSTSGKPKRVKTIKTMAKQLSEYFTDETTSWECSSCKKESFAFEPVFICDDKSVCLKCVYEKQMNGKVSSIKYSNGGQKLNLLKSHFMVKSLTNNLELTKEITRMVGVDNNFTA